MLCLRRVLMPIILIRVYMPPPCADTRYYAQRRVVVSPQKDAARRASAPFAALYAVADAAVKRRLVYAPARFMRLFAPRCFAAFMRARYAEAEQSAVLSRRLPRFDTRLSPFSATRCEAAPTPRRFTRRAMLPI